MQQMWLVGDRLYSGGKALLNSDLPWYSDPYTTVNDHNGWTGNLSAQVGSSVINPFPVNWPRLASAITYSMTNYDTIALDEVTLIDGSSFNIPGIPGINIDKDAFYGSEYYAVMTLIHEPLHDASQFGLGHDGIKEIVDVDGAPAASPYGSDYKQFATFTQAATRIDGSSLWDRILEEAGPRPIEPPGFTP